MAKKSKQQITVLVGSNLSDNKKVLLFVISKIIWNILIYVDNCAAHLQELILHNIILRFFPSNTTAMSQVFILFNTTTFNIVF